MTKLAAVVDSLCIDMNHYYYYYYIHLTAFFPEQPG